MTCIKTAGWLVGCFGFNGPLRQYFSLYRAVSQREGERGERIDESKNVQTTPTRTYCKRNRPLPYRNQNCRTPRHWKFTQHHRTTRPPPKTAGKGQLFYSKPAVSKCHLIGHLCYTRYSCIKMSWYRSSAVYEVLFLYPNIIICNIYYTRYFCNRKDNLYCR